MIEVVALDRLFQAEEVFGPVITLKALAIALKGVPHFRLSREGELLVVPLSRDDCSDDVHARYPRHV